MPRTAHTLAVLTCAATLLTAPTGPTSAQSATDAASINASVVVTSGITVTPVADLDFGTHFASEGSVIEQTAGEWTIDGTQGTTVDLSFTQLPTTLGDGSGNTVPISYGTESFQWGTCNDATFYSGPPSGGATGCAIPTGGSLPVQLGDPSSPTLTSRQVTIDLTGAPAGTYTGTIELTATVN